MLLPKVTRAHWTTHKRELTQLRHAININELRTPQHVEFDGKDVHANHILITKDDVAIACGRLTNTGVISRICVTTPHRKSGLGYQVLSELILVAKMSNIDQVRISANLGTVSFYEQFGFKTEGKVFMHAGIPKQSVRCSIPEFKIAK